jgi:hypothetical protein
VIHQPRRRSLAIARLAIALACFFAIIRCADLPTDPNEIFSLTLDPLPFPAVVEGDSLRDSLGVASPVHARAYNVDGDELTSAPVVYVSLDTTVTIDPSLGYLLGTGAPKSQARILAQAGSLQTPLQTLTVTTSPDIVVATDTAWTLQYSFTDSTVTSDPLSVKLYHGAVHADSVVAAWLVSFRIVYPADTAFAHTVLSPGNVSILDTTGTDGVAGRSVQIRTALLPSPDDSVIVEAMVRYRGQPIQGAPARLVLRIKPRS